MAGKLEAMVAEKPKDEKPAATPSMPHGAEDF